MCKNCGNKLIGQRKRFCSLSCSAKYNNRLRRIVRNCPVCNRELNERHKKYCSRKCSDRKKHQDYIARWLAGNETGGNWHGVSIHVRRWLCETYGEKCSLCGWDKKNPVTRRVTVQTDHKDGNPLNHRPENLRLICPNCHSLTPTYGSLNLGHGRKERYAAIR